MVEPIRMPLACFAAEEAAELERFRAFWLESSKRNPAVFPARMNAGEWWEQLVAFVQTGEQDIAAEGAFGDDTDPPDPGEDAIPLDAFLADERAVLGRFRAFWQQGVQQTPDYFPTEMNAGEWWEQLMSFVGTEPPGAEPETPGPQSGCR